MSWSSSHSNAIRARLPESSQAFVPYIPPFAKTPKPESWVYMMLEAILEELRYIEQQAGIEVRIKPEQEVKT